MAFRVGASSRVVWLLIAGAVGVGILDAIQWQLGNELRGNAPPVWYTIATQLLPWIWLAALLPGVVWVANRWPLDGGAWRANLGWHLLATTVFAALQVSGSIAASAAFANTPVNLGGLATKLFLFRFPIDAMAYWAAVGAAHGARAAAVAREREQATARLEASLAEARLTALRDRLNPHFFFNTLNAVTTLALRRDHDGVIRTVDALGDLLRATLAERKGQEVALADELAFLDRYLEIEQLRFGDRLTIGRDVDSALLGAAVPAMLVQPLVENAIRHGAAVKPGAVRVDLRVSRRGQEVVIEVADTGPGFGAAATVGGAGIGLASCQARLAGLYGKAAALECSNRPEGGAVVRVRLPFQMMDPTLTPS
jgi:signal transduction histidine kinase